jgi:hypothetical protein
MVSYPNYQTMRQKKQAWQMMLFSASFRFVLVFVVGLFGILYVMQTSNLSAKGYEIGDLQKQISLLGQDNQRLEFEIANQRSMKNLEQRVKKLNLVAVGDVEYAMVLGNMVAVR